jgi:predicted signal transduction protein with EAL and GGDEF domain
VVAEGIETPVTWDTIADLGCDAAQGWHIARPMPSAAATQWLTERSRHLAGSRPAARAAGYRLPVQRIPR